MILTGYSSDTEAWHRHGGDGYKTSIRHRYIKHRCYYCNCRLTNIQGEATFKTKDHIIPVSRGGTNHRCNLVNACYECNHEKDDMLLQTYIQYLNYMLLEYPVNSEPYRKLQRKIANANKLAFR